MDYENMTVCDFCKGKLTGADGKIYTCDNCPVIL